MKGREKMGLDTKTCAGYDDMGQAEITQLKIKQDNIGQVRLGQDTVGTVEPQTAERYNKHDKPPRRDDQSTMYSATQSPSLSVLHHPNGNTIVPLAFPVLQSLSLSPILPPALRPDVAYTCLSPVGL